MTTVHREEWEERFENQFGNAQEPETQRHLCQYNEHLGYADHHEVVKDFIRTALTETDKRARESATHETEQRMLRAFAGLSPNERHDIAMRELLSPQSGSKTDDTPNTEERD